MDLDSYLRIIQDKRMKAAREQRVPLSDRAVQIPKMMAGHKSNYSDLIFLAVSQGRPTSDMAITMLYRSLQLDVTTPGFRATFRDRCAEQTNYSREVAEVTLAN